MRSVSWRSIYISTVTVCELQQPCELLKEQINQMRLSGSHWPHSQIAKVHFKLCLQHCKMQYFTHHMIKCTNKVREVNWHNTHSPTPNPLSLSLVFAFYLSFFKTASFIVSNKKYLIIYGHMEHMYSMHCNQITTKSIQIIYAKSIRKIMHSASHLWIYQNLVKLIFWNRCLKIIISHIT